MTDDKMVEWHTQLNGHEFEQALGDGEGQGSLACCSPWGRKELDMTERLNHPDGGCRSGGRAWAMLLRGPGLGPPHPLPRSLGWELTMQDKRE